MRFDMEEVGGCVCGLAGVYRVDNGAEEGSGGAFEEGVPVGLWEMFADGLDA